MKDFLKALHTTAAQAGIKIISDEHCAKLLAWLYGYGGSVEAVVLNPKLNVNIGEARRRFNLDGGCIPTPDLFPILQKYLREVEPLISCRVKAGAFEHPIWAYEIAEYYQLHTNHIDGGTPYNSDDHLSDLIKQGLQRKKLK